MLRDVPFGHPDAIGARLLTGPGVLADVDEKVEDAVAEAGSLERTPDAASRLLRKAHQPHPGEEGLVAAARGQQVCHRVAHGS